jgi:hypothetical protein
MPTPMMKKYASEAGTSVEHVEKVWDDAKKSAKEKFGKQSPRFWAYVNGTVRKVLKLKESKPSFKELSEELDR